MSLLAKQPTDYSVNWTRRVSGERWENYLRIVFWMLEDHGRFEEEQREKANIEMSKKRISENFQ